MDRPVVAPPPPVADVELPWDALVADPVAELSGARSRHGDTFVVDSGRDRYLFLFSPNGVRSFYALTEDVASKGIADWRMLRRKLPDELFTGRRTLPHELFGRHDTAAYLDHLDSTLDEAVAELDDSGELEAFAFARRLAHRMGLASWAGPGSASGDRFEHLVEALDVLDASEAFVRPDRMAQVAAEGKAVERAALARAVELIGASLADHDAGTEPSGNRESPDLFGRIAARWDGEAPDARRQGVAGDVVLAHMGSMSNLFAALGWTLVDLLAHPAHLERVADGEAGLVERCALESTRMAQRSIMLRHVLAPLELDTGDAVLAVAPGVTVATLVPLTNATSAPGLDRWEPTAGGADGSGRTAVLPPPNW